MSNHLCSTALGQPLTVSNRFSMAQGSEYHSPKVLVLALGNPLRGDDGVGSTVLEALSGSLSLPEEVTLLSNSGVGLLNVLLNKEYERVVIVDAALMGLQPGVWRRYTFQEARITHIDLESCNSLHGANLAEVISLAEALDIELPEIIVYGVQPAQLDWCTSLSEPVRKAIARLCKAIESEFRVVRRLYKKG